MTHRQFNTVPHDSTSKTVKNGSLPLNSPLPHKSLALLPMRTPAPIFQTIFADSAGIFLKKAYNINITVKIILILEENQDYMEFSYFSEIASENNVPLIANR